MNSKIHFYSEINNLRLTEWVSPQAAVDVPASRGHHIVEEQLKRSSDPHVYLWGRDMKFRFK